MSESDTYPVPLLWLSEDVMSLTWPRNAAFRLRGPQRIPGKNKDNLAGMTAQTEYEEQRLVPPTVGSP